jgi:hypothetical protein
MSVAIAGAVVLVVVFAFALSRLAWNHVSCLDDDDDAATAAAVDGLLL